MKSLIVLLSMLCYDISTSIFKTTPIEYLYHLNTEINTGLTYKGNIVYKGDRGGYYYYSTNKEGQRYKRYLTPAQKSKLGLQ